MKSKKNQPYRDSFIARALRETELPRRKVAEYCGVTLRQVSRWRNGYSTPTGRQYTLVIRLLESEGLRN